MKKSLKALFMTSMLPVMMLMAAVTLTSCEGTLDDIFGEWSRPTNQQNNEPTKEELLSDLSSALEEGAIVTITYTIDGVEYTSTFKYNKTDDEYIEQSTTPAAGTRTWVEKAKGDLSTITDLTGKKAIHITVDNARSKVIFDATVNTETLKQVTNIASEGVELKAVSVNDKKAAVINHETERLTIQVNTSGGGSGDVENVQIPYTPGQTYDDMVAVKQANGGNYMQTDQKNNQVLFTIDGQSGVIVNKDNTPVKPGELVVAGGGTLRLDQFPPEFYVERSWDATNHKVVMNDKKVDNFNMVTKSQTDVRWKEGTYVVNTDVTIDGDITLGGNVNLILCAGYTLTVNGSIVGKGKSLTIYNEVGEGNGKLSLSSHGTGYYNRFGFYYFTDLVIHGGDIEANIDDCSEHFRFTMYGGKFCVKTTSNYPAIFTGKDNDMTIYGGELETISDGGDAIIVGDDNNPSTLTVYGGKVTASAPKGKAIKGKFAKGEGTSVWFFESDDGVWSEPLGEDDHTSTAHYFKAEVVEEPAEASGTE